MAHRRDIRPRRRRARRRPATAIVLAALATLAACSSPNSDISVQRSDASEQGAGSGEAPAGDDGPGAADSGTTSQDTCVRPAEPLPDGLDSVVLDTIGENERVTVRAALYPLPDTEGNPWSQWGQGVVVPDGRFVSAVGDHLGRDGNSWIYEYDPNTKGLTRTTEVAEALGHVEGDWGYGKVHAPMLLDGCGSIITSTYWGTRRDLEIAGSYEGDHLVRYDPASHEIESLGVPVSGFGVPSLALSPDGQWIFGEAVDPESEPDAGVFFVADAATGEVTHLDDNPDHVGFRSILVSSSGDGMYSAGGASLVAVDPIDGSRRTLADVLPGDWLRAVTAVGPDGTVVGATRDPDMLFRIDADERVEDLGELEGYVASLARSPDGTTVYYVPGAHGDSWEYGTPLVAVDVATGERTELVLLNEMIEDALGVRAGGSYNVVADPDGSRVYVGLNSGPIDDDEDAFGDVVLAVVDLK